MMNLKGKKAVLVGMGRSSAGAARLLLREGARPFVTDSADDPKMAPWKAECESLGVPFETGGHSPERFSGADLIVLSPGVPPGLDPFVEARGSGVPVLGELELASRFCTAPVLAVTGTNGKTTVTELLRAMVAACGQTVVLSGNNDTPLSLAALETVAPDFIVAEVSSYQLETADTFRPWIGAALNLTPDHLARHGTMEGYAAVKARLFARQQAGDAAVLNADDPWTAAMPLPEGVLRVPFSVSRRVPDGVWADGERMYYRDRPVARRVDNPLPGRHNLENVLAALAVMAAGGFPMEGAVEGLRAFPGVEHRIEFVLEDNGCGYYNDSKSTNVDSLRVALESFDRPLVLIAGGRGKGSDYRVLRDLVQRRVARLVAMGEDAPALLEAFGDLVSAERAADMREAVALARRAAVPGCAVLLSPGCASFDLYDNFEQRGRDFKRLVRECCGGDAGEENAS